MHRIGEKVVFSLSFSHFRRECDVLLGLFKKTSARWIKSSKSAQVREI
jgi:hypothetical protein